MQFPIFLFLTALTVPALAHPPKPSAYPPPPPPKFPPGSTCPKVLVCCDSLKAPHESAASGLIDLLKVELSVAEESLGVGLTCDAIVGLGHGRDRRMKMKKRGLASRSRFRFAKPGHDSDGGRHGDSDSDSDGDDDSDDDAHDDHDEHDSYAKLARRGVDVWYVGAPFDLIKNQS